MQKPDFCRGCPLYDDGLGFVPDEIVPGAKVDVWLPNPGNMDDLEEKFLPVAGLTRGVDVSIRSVIRCQKTNTLPKGKVLQTAVDHCRVHDTDNGAEVAVACGALPWKTFGGPGSITEWRGFPKPNVL